MNTNRIHRIARLLVRAVLGLSLVAAAPAAAGEARPPKGPPGRQVIELAAAPAAVQQTIKRQIGSAVEPQVEKQAHPAGDIYVARWAVNEDQWEIRVGADGALLERKEPVTWEQLPPEVRSAIVAAGADRQSLKIKRKTTFKDEQSRVIFEVKAVIEEQRTDMQIAPDGTVQTKPPKPEKPEKPAKPQKQPKGDPAGADAP